MEENYVFKSQLLKNQILSLLKIVDLENNGNKVLVDGFIIKTQPSSQKKSPYKNINPKKVEYSDIDALSRFEPRIKFIQKQLQSILIIANFTYKGNLAHINGFRLKNLSHWISSEIEDENHGDPYCDILQYLSWPCTTNCEFCLHKGDPPGYFSKAKYSWITPLKEIETRIKYWNPDKNRALFSKADYNFFEILTHPHFFEFAFKARKKTNKCFNIVTSGALLTESIIASLAELKPIFLVVSLNSDDPALRQKFMNDKNPDIAIKSLFYLKKKKIPFAVSLTAYKGIPLDSLKNTIKNVDRLNPYFIRVVLDAHTKHHPISLEVNKSIKRWKAIVKLVREIRKQILSPIIVQPVMFEECFFDSKRNIAKVEGVVKNSPAHKAGMKAEDEIVKINGLLVPSRPFAKYLLWLCAKEYMQEIEIEVKRSQQLMTFSLRNSNQADYPYFQSKLWTSIFFPYGIVLLHGLDPSKVLEIETIAEKYKAKKILFLSSLLVKFSFEDYIKSLNLFKDKNIELFIEVPVNRHFFGGDIIVGDLFVIEDFISCVREWMAKYGSKPDLVIIPSTPFTKWKRDLQGKLYKEIEKELKIPVALLECARIFNIN